MQTSGNLEKNDALFSIFSVFWCLSTICHQFVFPSFLTLDNPFGWFVTLFCILNIGTMGKHKILFVLAVISSALSYITLQPYGVNHIYFETLMSITMSGTILGYSISRLFKTRTDTLQQYFLTNAIPIVRNCVIILYFFVVIHKLNSDFFKPEISCGAVLFENMLNNLKLTKIGFINDAFYRNQFLIGTVSIYFTLILELAIPLLLIPKKTRKIGIFTGIIFHFILGLEGTLAIISFTTMMYTYFILFWSHETAQKAYDFLQLRKTKILLFLGIAIPTVVICSFVNFLLSKVFFAGAWIPYSLWLIFLYYNCSRSNTASYSSGFKPLTQLYWIFPLALFINGFSPYLGLKTHTAFSMFSNLKTENNFTNHFFIPKELQVFNFQKEVVIIEDTNMEELLSPDQWNNTTDYNHILFEFIRKVNRIANGYVRFQVNENEYYIEKEDGKIIESNINLDQNLLLQKTLLFRPIYTETNFCQQ